MRYVVAVTLVWACGSLGQEAKLLATSGAPTAEDTPKEAPARAGVLDRLPEAVRKAILKEAGGNRVAEVEKTAKDGKVIYEAEWFAAGKETEILVAEDGTLVNKRVREQPAMSPPPTRQSIRDEMTKACGLSQEQVVKITAVDEALDKAAAKWQADNAEKVKAANTALLAAAMKQDVSATVKAWQDRNALCAPFDELLKKACVDVLAVLTPEQKATWQEHAALKSIDAWFARAKLTEEQRAAVNAAYAQLAKDKDAKAENIAALLAEKTRDMLSDQQLQALRPFLMQAGKSVHLNGPAAGGTAAQPAAKLRPGAWMGTACSRWRPTNWLKVPC